jgi:hypothetical protein
VHPKRLPEPLHETVLAPPWLIVTEVTPPSGVVIAHATGSL